MAQRADDAPGTIRPRLIIHGGAGAITRANLPPALYTAHHTALLSILSSTSDLLSNPKTPALKAAVHAVDLLEQDPLYNAGHGAVFTSAGRIEHEASIMLSTPHPRSGKGVQSYRKRYAACTGTAGVRHPILLVKEMLVRGEERGGGGALGHNMISGREAERLARSWGLYVGRPSGAWTKGRWDQHRRALGLGTSKDEYTAEKESADREAGYEPDGHARSEEQEVGHDEVHARLAEDCGLAVEEDGGWNGTDYLPQGTVGAVVLDRYGTIAVATSTGGMTNKLPGRIGDTPQAGAGFWAEQFEDAARSTHQSTATSEASPLEQLIGSDLAAAARSCIPEWLASAFTHRCDKYTTLPTHSSSNEKSEHDPAQAQAHAVGMSGTGNGDSFLRLDSVRTVAAQVRFSKPRPSLQQALSDMAGPSGELQRSAEERWGETGEGEGGIIGVELVGGVGKVVSDFNCGGMFRAWVDDDGKPRMMVFKEEYELDTQTSS